MPTAAGPDYTSFVAKLFADGYTPTFEWCSLGNQVVVVYDTPSLELTVVRHRATGAYLSHDEMVAAATPYGVPVVKRWTLADGLPVHDPAAMIAYLQAHPEVEGGVVRWADGKMVKIKAERYLRCHKAKESLTFEKDVLALIFSGHDDDVLPILPPADRDALAGFAAQLRAHVLGEAQVLAAKVAEIQARAPGDRKAFAKACTAEIDPLLHPLAFSIANGKAPFDVFADYILKYTFSAGRVEVIRPLLGGLLWVNPSNKL